MAKNASKPAPVLSNEAPDFVKPRKTNVPPDKLAAIRNKCLELQSVRREIENSETRTKELNITKNEIERKTLPDMLNEAGIPRISIEGIGNMPGFDIEKHPYYKANIAANWENERREKAFDWLRANGGGDLIKCEITIRLPQRSTKLQKIVIAAIKKLKVEYEVNLAVPWGSLTAFVRECYERRKIVPPLDILGADVGEIVKLKERRD